MDVLVLTTDKVLSEEERDKASKNLEGMTEYLGMKVILIDGGIGARVERDHSDLVAAVTAQTEAIGLLIEALVDQEESSAEEAAEAMTYLSGRKDN